MTNTLLGKQITKTGGAKRGESVLSKRSYPKSCVSFIHRISDANQAKWGCKKLCVNFVLQKKWDNFRGQ